MNRTQDIARLQAFHARRKVFDGRRTFHMFYYIEDLFQRFQPATTLDYGCGKGKHYTMRDITLQDGRVIESLESTLHTRITGYDPGVPEFSILPEGSFEAGIVVDVLEYVPEPDLPQVLHEIASKVTRVIFANLTVKEPAKRSIFIDEPWRRDKAFWLNAISLVSRTHPGPLWALRIHNGPDTPPGEEYEEMVEIGPSTNHEPIPCPTGLKVCFFKKIREPEIRQQKAWRDLPHGEEP